MTEFLALPPASEARGRLRAPASKSATNRVLLAAALTDSAVEIAGALDSDDTRALRRCLSAMGARIVPVEGGLSVSGPLRGDPGREIALDAGDSGTAARFMAAAAAATPGRFLLTGSPRLCERPMAELVAALVSAGARIAYRGREGCLPIAVEGGFVKSGEVTVDASRSSQYASALLLAAVAIDGGLAVRAAGPVASAPYVAMTIETLRELGHDVVEGDSVRVARGSAVARRFEVPGDYSSAIPMLAAAGAAGGRVEMTGLRWPSADADAGALPVLERMGVRIRASASSVIAEGERGALFPVDVEATHFPDAVPALAALAAIAPGRSRFRGIAHLRLKESDRLAALAALLTAFGATAAADEDSLTVTGPAHGHASAARAPTFGDHRMAMAAALAALRVPGILIENPGCVSKSYPDFFRDLESLCVRASREFSPRQ